MRLTLLPIVIAACLLSVSAPAATSPNPKVWGSPTAPITIEVFSDFQCPSCRQLHMTTIQAALKDCVANGKVQIVHRDFPLPQHQYAKLAARYANASAPLGLYQKVCDQLFLTQPDWERTGNVDSAVARVVSPADMAKIRTAIKDPHIDDEMNRDTALGMQARINQTPTMILRYKDRAYPIAGVVSYSILSKFIDSLLQK
jgi:protein-disulfide isomerase